MNSTIYVGNPIPALFRLLALAVLLLFLPVGCATHRIEKPITPAQRVTLGFNDMLPTVSAEYCEQIRADYQTLCDGVDSGVDDMQPDLDELVEELDGYFKRAESAHTIQKRVNEWLATELMEHIIPEVDEFFVSYTNNLASLESRLLVRLQSDPQLLAWYSSARSPSSPNFVPEASDLKGSTGRKVTEDVATFIPIAGDAYDVFRSFVYDPRLTKIKEDARKFLPRLKSKLHSSLLDPLVEKLPTPDAVASECARNFNPGIALQLLNEEQQ